MIVKVQGYNNFTTPSFIVLVVLGIIFYYFILIYDGLIPWLLWKCWHFVVLVKQFYGFFLIKKKSICDCHSNFLFIVAPLHFFLWFLVINRNYECWLTILIGKIWSQGWQSWWASVMDSPLSSLWSNKENEVLIKLFKNKMYLLATISNFPFNNYRSVLCKEKCIYITAHPRHDSHFMNINACGVVLWSMEPVFIIFILFYQIKLGYKLDCN